MNYFSSEPGCAQCNRILSLEQGQLSQGWLFSAASPWECAGRDERNQSRAELPSVEDLPQRHLDDPENKKQMAVFQQGGLEVRFVFEKGLPKVSGGLMDVGLGWMTGM